MTKDEMDKLFAGIAQSAKSVLVSTPTSPTARVTSWSPQTQQMPKKVQKVERDLTDLHAAWEPCPAAGKTYYVPRRNAGWYKVRTTTNNATNSRVFLRLYPPGIALITTIEYDERIDDLSQWRLIINAERKMFVYNWRLIAAADEASAVLVAGRLMNWEER